MLTDFILESETKERLISMSVLFVGELFRVDIVSGKHYGYK